MLGDDAGASVSTVVTTIAVLIFGEVSPKSIAKESPEKFAQFSVPEGFSQSYLAYAKDDPGVCASGTVCCPK